MKLLQRLWRHGARLQTASLLLAVVAGVALLGSLLPQVRPDLLRGVADWRAVARPAVRARYGPLGDLLLGLGLLRFASSPLFLIPVGLLMLSTLACTMQRWPRLGRCVSWAADAWPLGAAPLVRVLPGDGQAVQLARLTSWLQERRFVLRQGALPGEVSWQAQRHRWTGLATIGLHLALALLLAGAALSALGGHEERLQLAPGATVALSADPSLAVRNEGLLLERYDDGSPALFEAQVALLDGAQPARTARLRVNQPLRLGGYRLYLNSYGGQPGAYSLTLLATRNPGFWPFVLGGALLTLTMTAALYWPHSRLALRGVAGGALTLYCWPGRYDLALHRDWPGLVVALQDAAASPPPEQGP